jgi:hypothetical protein
MIKWLFLLFFYSLACGAELTPEFLRALNMKEASGRKENVPAGDKGRALGPFQIHQDYWKDSKVEGSYSSCTNYAYSVKVVTAYMNRWVPWAVDTRNYEILARTHNGGPDGWHHASTLVYWYDFQKILRKQK